jgi:outer membrane protein
LEHKNGHGVGRKKNMRQGKNMNLARNIGGSIRPASKARAARRWSFLIVLFVLGVAPLGSAQNSATENPLTLERAVAVALEKNPEAKAALADTKAARADVQTARSAFLPHVTFFETATRGNDPVYVFGSKLQQQRFTTPDFALNVLNTPSPFSNFSTRFSGSWTLFDSFASQRAMARAELLKTAADRQLERTEQQIEYQVIEAYFGALLTKKRIVVVEQSLKTAEAISDRSQHRYESGVIVESDYLTAQVE